MATEYRNNAKVNVVTRRWREHFPTPPSPPRLHPVAADLFPLFCKLVLVPLSSRIKPLLEMCLEALEPQVLVNASWLLFAFRDLDHMCTGFQVLEVDVPRSAVGLFRSAYPGNGSAVIAQ